jgi:predicted GNAT family acetyltransferase
MYNLMIQIQDIERKKKKSYFIQKKRKNYGFFVFYLLDDNLTILYNYFVNEN